MGEKMKGLGYETEDAEAVVELAVRGQDRSVSGPHEHQGADEERENRTESVRDPVSVMRVHDDDQSTERGGG